MRRLARRTTRWTALRWVFDQRWRVNMSALDLLERAVLELVTSDAPVQGRLVLAYAQYLRHIKAGELPAELSAQLASINQRMGHQTDEPRAMPAEHVISKLSKAKAAELAADIFKLSCEVSQGLYH